MPACIGNGISDSQDIADGTSLDSDSDGMSDDCRTFRRGDANQDGDVDISDAVNTLNVLFLGIGQIPPPSEACGVGLETTRLTCAVFASC